MNMEGRAVLWIWVYMAR